MSTIATPPASSARRARHAEPARGVEGRHHHRHAGQGAGRRGRRLHRRRRKPIVDLLRQRSRPYLFSNALPPPIVAAGAQGHRSRRSGRRSARPARRQRQALPRRHDRRRFQLKPRRAPDHSGDAGRRASWRRTWPPRLLDEGIYVDRLLLPGRAAGPGPHPHPDVGRPYRQPISTRRSPLSWL